MDIGADVTVGAGGKVYTMTSPNAAITGIVKIRDIYWLKPTTPGHNLVVLNTKDKVICEATCDTADEDVRRPICDWFDGIKFGALDSGTVEVHLE